VSVLHCAFSGVKRDGDVDFFGDAHGAWFNDPEGNTLHVNNG
jgi:hypothetical protein